MMFNLPKMSPKLRKEIMYWSLIALLGIITLNTPSLVEFFLFWRASLDVWIDYEIVDRVA